MKEMESGAKCMLDFKSPIQGLLGVHSRYGLHTRAATNSWHAFRRLQLFRHLHSCSGCFRLERLPGGACTHWKAPPSHGAHPKSTSLRGVAPLFQNCRTKASPIVKLLTIPQPKFIKIDCSGHGQGTANGKRARASARVFDVIDDDTRTIR